jgi:hypothetical protein
MVAPWPGLIDALLAPDQGFESGGARQNNLSSAGSIRYGRAPAPDLVG